MYMEPLSCVWAAGQDFLPRFGRRYFDTEHHTEDYLQVVTELV